MKVQQCRLCESKDLHLFLDLGKTALANRFLREADAASLLGRLPEPEPFFPLRVVLCQDCGLVQLDEEVAREILFKNYIYVSGTSAVVRRHAQWLADYLIHKYGVRRQGLVVAAEGLPRFRGDRAPAHGALRLQIIARSAHGPFRPSRRGPCCGGRGDAVQVGPGGTAPGPG